MVYDSPKAAHFDAWCGNGKLHPSDPVGLEYRWAAARMIARDIGVFNMQALTERSKNKIRRQLQSINVGRAVRVVLAGECVLCHEFGEDPEYRETDGTRAR